MFCWKCHNALESEIKVHIKDSCPKCLSDLHVCRQCKFYQPGKPNDCQIPFTEPQKDREKANFCEDFQADRRLSANHARGPSKEDIEKKLFG